jgi:hypothetical protein
MVVVNDLVSDETPLESIEAVRKRELLDSVRSNTK